ncbi:hypothetical protein RJD24_08035 [Bacillaceae bacterium IKA-2]|nr:hypothetical protein RJD24_08035 [Bacillaceae bacterium IKA-2]
MKKIFLQAIIISVISAVLFYLSNLMNPSPGQSSGNGNPAIIFMFILVPLFCYLVILWVKLFKKVNLKPTMLVLGIVAIATHWMVGFFYQKGSLIKYKNILQDAYHEQHGFVDNVYIDQITSLFSIHVNNQYFNLNTYLMFLTLSILISSLVIITQKSIKSS